MTVVYEPGNNHDAAGAGASPSAADCEVSILPLEKGEGLFVRIVPPREPIDAAQDHVPCDIILVIDVSSSMDSVAPAPPSQPGETAEDVGLSILDLTKHAAKTIIETLNDSDRLAIVTFSTNAHVLHGLAPMGEDNKADAVRKIDAMRPVGLTNLWGGIQMGLDQFQQSNGQAGESNFAGNIPALMVLTDGQPQGFGSSPSAGYPKALGSMGQLLATIHTFGFGYCLEGGLLQTIAELGGGGYSFIPDSSMLGTVFIHAVANLQSTFARDALLTLTYPAALALEEPGMRLQKGTPQPVTAQSTTMALQVRLNTIQYGHPRQIFLQGNKTALAAAIENGGDSSLQVWAKLHYSHDAKPYQALAQIDICPGVPLLEAADAAFHYSRVMVATFLSELFLAHGQNGYKPVKGEVLRDVADSTLKDLLEELPARKAPHMTDPRCRALVEDLLGNDAEDGQVEQAVHESAFQKWGQHYLPSLQGAHLREQRVSFKDPGTQHYGADSPLFLRRLEALNEAFDKIPPPTPSRTWQVSLFAGAGQPPPAYSQPIQMSQRFNTNRPTCFAGSSNVLLASHTTSNTTSNTTTATMASEVMAMTTVAKMSTAATTTTNATRKTIAIRDLRPNMVVETPRGRRAVYMVLRCRTPAGGRDIVIMRHPDAEPDAAPLWVTPWHPVSLDGGRTWFFPATHPSAETRHDFAEDVYAVQLRRYREEEEDEEKHDDDDPDAHAINVNGVWGVTLGHGLVGEGEAAAACDIRNHRFYGDYDAVAKSLDALPRDADGIPVVEDVTRDESGLVSGFVGSTM